MQRFQDRQQEQIFETLACLGEVAFQKSQLKDWMAACTRRPCHARSRLPGIVVCLSRSVWRGLDHRPLQWPVVVAASPSDCCAHRGKLLRAQTEQCNSRDVCRCCSNLVPKYFEPGRGRRRLRAAAKKPPSFSKLPFDFIFFTGSTQSGKVVARAAAENLHTHPARIGRTESRPGG